MMALARARRNTTNQPILLQNTGCTTRLQLLEGRGVVDFDEVGLRGLDAVLASGVVRQHDAHLCEQGETRHRDLRVL